MRNICDMRRLSFGLAVAAVVVAVLPASASSSGNTSITRVRTDGFAEALFGCPAFFNPAGTACRETHVEIFREAETTDGGPIPNNPWGVFVESYGLIFTSDDPNVPPIGPIDYASGFLLNPTISFDAQHLSSASVDASVPMSDGSTAVVHATWSATSPTEVFGNDGPGLADIGPRHNVDSCVTANNNAHQTLRFATVTGTLNGAPFRSYSDFPFAGWLQTAHFLLIDVTHGDCVSG